MDPYAPQREGLLLPSGVDRVLAQEPGCLPDSKYVSGLNTVQPRFHDHGGRTPLARPICEIKSPGVAPGLGIAVI
jgi:hypothetical protein